MRTLAAAALAAVTIAALSAGATFAADCYVVEKPVGAGASNDDGHGVFYTFEGIDFFVLPDHAQGLDDTDFGKALPAAARHSGPGGGCDSGIASYETCVLGE